MVSEKLYRNTLKDVVLVATTCIKKNNNNK